METEEPRYLPRASLLRVPRQRRSKDAVFRILDAAWELIGEQGIEAFNTNAVAERAQVNIASLIEYFANKEMILSGVIESALLDFEHSIRALVGDLELRDSREVLERVFEFSMELFEPMSGPMADLFSVLPLLSETSVPAILERILMNITQDAVVRSEGRFRLRYGVAGLYVAINGATFVMLRWLVDRPAYVDAASLKKSLIEIFSSALESTGEADHP